MTASLYRQLEILTHTHRSVWRCQCQIAVWFLLRYFFINRSAVTEARKVHVLLLPCPHPGPTVSLSDFQLFSASGLQFYNFGNGRVLFFCTRGRKPKKKKKTRRWQEGLKDLSSSCIAQHETSRSSSAWINWEKFWRALIWVSYDFKVYQICNRSNYLRITLLWHSWSLNCSRMLHTIIPWIFC